MDDQTAIYYNQHAGTLAEQYERAGDGVNRYFGVAFTRGMRVLDVGAGSGRDLAALLSAGCDAYGVEPSAALRAEAVRRHPDLADRLADASLPDLGQPFGGLFDGVLCSAVLMHVPKEQVFDAAVAIRGVLKDSGRLLLTVPISRPGLDAENRDENGRLFTPLDPDYLQLLLERLGFRLLAKWEDQDALGRQDRRWATFLFSLCGSASQRPIDQIEGILTRDRKTATYKLALFRALSEVATTQSEQCHWLGEGRVGIPLDLIAEKWLFYYWPIVESPTFAPQIRGEGEFSGRPIAFRAALSDLVRYYAQRGGISAFALDYRRGVLPVEATVLLKAVLSSVRQTIVQGPVTFAGGPLQGGRVFTYDRSSREVCMDAGIWQELSLLGHWIEQAVVLRWAELTAEISRGRLRPSEVIDRLLTVPVSEREVTDARATYAALSSKECAWSGSHLGARFDVDHIIPFSLWHNNDLWNLLPVHPTVNGQKSDSLPSRDLLLKRKDCIVGYWETLRSSHCPRFDHEALRLTGTAKLPPNWQRQVFLSVAQAVEITATQRGCERWAPNY